MSMRIYTRENLIDELERYGLRTVSRNENDIFVFKDKEGKSFVCHIAETNSELVLNHILSYFFDSLYKAQPHKTALFEVS